MSHFHETRIKDLEEQLAEARTRIHELTICPTRRTTYYAWDCSIKARHDLEAENKRLREALEFYSKLRMMGMNDEYSLETVDCGKMAREALKECE